MVRARESGGKEATRQTCEREFSMARARTARRGYSSFRWIVPFPEARPESSILIGRVSSYGAPKLRAGGPMTHETFVRMGLQFSRHLHTTPHQSMESNSFSLCYWIQDSERWGAAVAPDCPQTKFPTK